MLQHATSAIRDPRSAIRDPPRYQIRDPRSAIRDPLGRSSARPWTLGSWISHAYVLNWFPDRPLDRPWTRGTGSVTRPWTLDPALIPELWTMGLLGRSAARPGTLSPGPWARSATPPLGPGPWALVPEPERTLNRGPLGSCAISAKKYVFYIVHFAKMLEDDFENLYRTRYLSGAEQYPLPLTRGFRTRSSFNFLLISYFLFHLM